MIAGPLRLFTVLAVIALALAIAYVVYLAAVAGLIQQPALAGVSDIAGALAEHEAEPRDQDFGAVIEASALVESPDGSKTLGISAVAFNHFIATSGRSSPQLDWAWVEISASQITVQGELVGHVDVPFRGKVTVNVTGDEVELTVVVEQFGLLPPPAVFIFGDGLVLNLPSNKLILSLISPPGPLTVG